MTLLEDGSLRVLKCFFSDCTSRGLNCGADHATSKLSSMVFAPRFGLDNHTLYLGHKINLTTE